MNPAHMHDFLKILKQETITIKGWGALGAEAPPSPSKVLLCARYKLSFLL